MIELPKIVKTFACHGFEPVAKTGNQFQGMCPFCLDTSHFYVNGETGQWDCKKCGRAGNIPTFLTEYTQQCQEETTPDHYKNLKRQRGLPVKAYKRFRVAWSGVEWLLPCYRGTGMVSDIRRWSQRNNKTRSTTGCQTQLFGSQWLERYEVSRGGIVWVCEGEWDVMALAELLSRAGRKDDAVVGVPGADTFKRQWLEWFGGHHVRLCYDNDGAGDRGSEKAGRLLDGVAKKLEYLCWSDRLKQGYDLRDFITQGWKEKTPSKKIYRQLCKLLQKKHRRHKAHDKKTTSEQTTTPNKMPPRPDFKTLPVEKRPSFDKVVDVFADEVRMDDEMVSCLRFMLALCLTEQLNGPPLWAYVVGPPGCGKTLVVSSLQDSDRVLFRSSISPKCLISGWREKGSTIDPSVLAQVHGKTLANRDATELFSQLQAIVNETMSIMRGAYDGYVSRSFGNGVIREYCMHFSCIMCVTGIINQFQGASMGERFLKFHFREQSAADREARVVSAIMSTGTEAGSDERMRRVVSRFLARNDTTRIVPEKWFVKRLKPLVDFISLLRTAVSRDFKGELTMQPEQEYPTRVAKQLTKLGMGLAFVDGRTVLHPRDFAVLKRIATDTVFGMHTNIVKALHSSGGAMTYRALAEVTGIPVATLFRRVDDMAVMKIVKRQEIPRDEREDRDGTSGGAKTRIKVELRSQVAECIAAAGLDFD